MIWATLSVIFILALAWALRKAATGTSFRNNCGCTPNIDHLRWLEKGEKPEKHENRW